MRLRVAVAQGQLDQSWMIEQFHLIMQRLLHMQASIYQELDAIPAMRAATREERYWRIHYAREYAAALFTTPVHLDEMARVAGLSPNHLLRTFKQVFDQTPYQYVIAKVGSHMPSSSGAEPIGASRISASRLGSPAWGPLAGGSGSMSGYRPPAIVGKIGDF